MDFEAVINAMGAYNESMMKAGVLLAGEGLSDAKEGFVVDFAGEAPIVTDGPYGETHELFNGFWIIQASSKEEAAEWAKRCPLGAGQQARGAPRDGRVGLRGLRRQRVRAEGRAVARGARHEVNPSESRRRVDAVWRIEGARVVATLAKATGDLGLAEDLAQEAVVEALEQWPERGVPSNPGAWLTTVAKRRAIDGWRRRERLDDRYAALAHELAHETERSDHAESWEPIDDDVLRLIFVACHPVLSRESQVALTLRVVGGLTIGRDRSDAARARGDRPGPHHPRQEDPRGGGRAVRGARSDRVDRASHRSAERRVPRFHGGVRGDVGRPLGARRSGERGTSAGARARGASFRASPRLRVLSH